MKSLPKILVTGASGFVGENFLERIKDDFFVFALARRKIQNEKLAKHINIKWILADVAEKASMEEAAEVIRENGGIDYTLHLAAFYDYNYDENPEYVRTNVNGTRNVLELAAEFDIKRFIFASSLAACEFPEGDEVITEKTPPDADFAYARTKRAGEEMLQEYSEKFNTTAVRFAAVISDWCEYGPLYMFLETWLCKNWKQNVLGGSGESAITYIHVNCLVEMLIKIMKLSDKLKAFDVFNCTPEHLVTHNDLFKTATKYYYGEEKKPFHMPKPISALGVYAMDLFGRLIGKRPFERPWMMRYIDKKLAVNAEYTRKTLDWSPTERYSILRRLLYILEHKKSYPFEWQKRNMRRLKNQAISPSFKIYEKMDVLRDIIVERVLEQMLSDENKQKYSSYHNVKPDQLRSDIVAIYQFISVAVRTHDRVSALAYARQIANVRYNQSFKPEEVLAAIQLIGDTVYSNLIEEDELKDKKQAIYDEISFTSQLMADEVEGVFEKLKKKSEPILPE